MLRSMLSVKYCNIWINYKCAWTIGKFQITPSWLDQYLGLSHAIISMLFYRWFNPHKGKKGLHFYIQA